jgi:hypothetical protein
VYLYCVGASGVRVKLGRIAIRSWYLVLPQAGHLQAIQKKHDRRIVFDPTYPVNDIRKFKECDWKAFYGDAREAVPPNAPDPRGKGVDLQLFVDSDHA